GGSDVGNPLQGKVTINTTPVDSALVIAGLVGTDSLFDSIYTDRFGNYSFKKLPQGNYVVTAQKNNLLGISTIALDSGKQTQAGIQLNMPISISLYRDSAAIVSSSKIVSARISGTNFWFTPDSSGNLELAQAPAGDQVTIAMQDQFGKRYEYTLVNPAAGSNAYIIVDASKPPDQWISGGYGPRQPLDTPFVIWASPPPGSIGAVARVNRSQSYEMAIQFSQPMNSRLTENSIKVGSSDSSALLDTITWKGADVIYVRFKRLPSLYGTAQNTYGFAYRVGVRYWVTIDTTAQSVFGIRFAAAKTLSITPEPIPRFTSIAGFRFQALASHEVWDSLPQTVTLGDSVSPSIANLDNNMLSMSLIGTPLASSLKNGILCLEDTLPITTSVAYDNYSGAIDIKFPRLFKSNTRYTVVMDTTLLFSTGKFPQKQVVTWKTTKFSIDTALMLGSYIYKDSIPLILYKSSVRYSASLYPRSPNSNLPFTTFYASSALDSLSIKPNIIIPSYFSKDSIIIDTAKFGWKAKRWLPPNTRFTFTILPGLKSKAGDSLGDTMRYSVRTEPFGLEEFHVFELSPVNNGVYANDPRQDTVYPLPLGSLEYSAGRFDYAINDYHTYISCNAPLDTTIAFRKFHVEPANGFNYRTMTTSLERYKFDMLIPDTTYTVSLDTGLADTFGNTTSYSFVYRFKTEKFGLKVGNLFGLYFGRPSEIKQLPGQVLPPIQIIDQNVQPGEPIVWKMTGAPLPVHIGLFDNGSDSISFSILSSNHRTGTPIGISRSYFVPGFSDTMNYLCFAGIPDSTDYRNFVAITPNDGSIALKLEANKLRFSTSDYCKPGTTYRIKLLPGFHDHYGRTLGDSLVVSFTTPAFTLAQGQIGPYSLPRDTILKGKQFPLQPTLGFSFSANLSYPLLLSSIENNFNVEPSVKGRINAATNSISFTASQTLMPDTLYKITLKNGIKETNGTALDSNYTMLFRTEKFKIVGLNIGMQEYSELFSLYTNSLIDTATCRNAISITPARYATGQYQLNDVSTGVYYIPDSTIQLGDQVTVTVNTALADVYTNRLQQPDSLSFVVTTVKQ
ncbi:MAG: hypothetical protein PHC61_02925, partial [Chitinivibrionales bacterium]|nr:hypothetical protein [Chitinivibrionales bacterium]